MDAHQPSDRQQRFYLMFIIVLVGIGGILYGFDLSVISGALVFIRESITLSTIETEIIVGAVFAGGMIGTLIAGPVADRFGRKIVVAVAAIVFIFGILGVIFAGGFGLLLLGRILIGAGVGIVAVGVPLYAVELAPTNIRGLSVTVFQLMVTFGIVLAYFIDVLLTPSHNWRGMFAVVLVPAVILLLGVCVLPESPRFLISRGREAAAREILLSTRSLEVAEKDLQIIHDSFNHSEGTWRELFSRKLFIPLFVAGSIALLQQLTAVNTYLQYAPLILQDAGLGSNTLSVLGSLGIGLVNFVVTIVAMCFIDRVGRKPLLYIGLWGIIAFEIFSGIVQMMDFDPYSNGILSLIGLIGFIFFYALGPGVVIWLVMSELFPTRNRGKGMAVCLFLNSLGSTLVASVFLSLSNSVGIGGIYFLSAFFTLCYFLVAKFGLPETKKRALEDVQHEMESDGF